MRVERLRGTRGFDMFSGEVDYSIIPTRCLLTLPGLLEGILTFDLSHHHT